MAKHSPELKAEVLAWMQSEGAGYRRASKQFKIPAPTIKMWRRAAEGKRPDPVSRARAQARAKPPKEPKGEASQLKTVEFYEWRVDSVSESIQDAKNRGHTGSAAQFERILHSARKELDDARKKAAASARVAEQRKVRDPSELARRMLDSLPKLLQLAGAGEMADETRAALRRSLVEIWRQLWPDEHREKFGGDDG